MEPPEYIEYSTKQMSMRKITAISPSGDPWPGKDGTMFYPYLIGFDDMSEGVANSKSDNIDGLPYKIGDEVEVEIAGEYQGVKKLKVKKPGGGGGYGGSKRQADPKSMYFSYAKDYAIANNRVWLEAEIAVFNSQLKDNPFHKMTEKDVRELGQIWYKWHQED